jgi:hypothetical protein
MGGAEKWERDPIHESFNRTVDQYSGEKPNREIPNANVQTPNKSQ